MESLQRRIIIFIIWMAFFYNIERVDFTNPDTINLMSSVYFVGTVAALLPLMPIIRRFAFVYLAIIVSILHSTFLVISSTPTLGGIYTYLTIIGYAMVMVTLLLSYRMNQSTREFQHAVEHITFSDINAHLRDLPAAEEMIDIQMLSSRRAHRPLSIILFETDNTSLDIATHRLVKDVQQSMMQRYVVSSMAGLINQHVRRTDLIVRDDRPGRLLLVAPETQHEYANIMGKRLKRLIDDRLGINATFSAASFPEHALTFEKLHDMAEQQLIEKQTAQLDEKASDEFSPSNDKTFQNVEQRLNFQEYAMTSSAEHRMTDEAEPACHPRRQQ